MDRGGPTAPRRWLEIDIAQVGAQLSAAIRSSHGEPPPPYDLGPQHTPETLLQFTDWMKEAASRAEALTPWLPDARSLHAALFQGVPRDVLDPASRAQGGETLLLRLMLQDSRLQAVPWEALCRPGAEPDFLGASGDLCLARGVHSTKPWQPREVRGAVRLLVISPSDEIAPARLRAALYPSIDAGELEWLDSLSGPPRQPRRRPRPAAA